MLSIWHIFSRPKKKQTKETLRRIEEAQEAVKEEAARLKKAVNDFEQKSKKRQGE